MDNELILVLDFGSQYTQLITRRVRELGVYSEIRPFNLSLEKIRQLQPAGIILSGGPASVYAARAPLPDAGIFELGLPILGICYGLQVMAHLLAGKVNPASQREYGQAELIIDQAGLLFDTIANGISVWMSHGDRLEQLPRHFQILAHTPNAPIAAICEPSKKLFGLQFHPEVAHTQQGNEILANFVKKICGCSGQWSPHSFTERTIQAIKQQVGQRQAICALSGGVDSSVAANLVAQAIGEQLTCIFVDTGLLRKNEAEEVRQFFSGAQFQLKFVDARKRFLNKLAGVIDPELKRRIIGNEFIFIFEEEAKKLGQVDFLVQGTLYPDVIESVSTHGPSASIKSHHNVGGLPEKMGLSLIEPLRELFKDEVRQVGRELGIPEYIIGRHPFPGPGLAVRILGQVTEARVRLLQEVDAIFIAELRQAALYDKIWQAFAVLLPVQSVGVMGDERTYENVIALRAVTSVDGMTADWARIPDQVLARISNRIINEVKGVNRAVYDISSKPPSTIEWE